MLEDSLGLEICAGAFGELNPRRVFTTGTPTAQYNGSLLRLQDGDAAAPGANSEYINARLSRGPVATRPRGQFLTSIYFRGPTCGY